jgi:hypothetical protein
VIATVALALLVATTPPADPAQLQATADSYFLSFVDEELDYDEISAARYCSVSGEEGVGEGIVASCEAMVDGEYFTSTGDYNSFDEGFDDWHTPEDLAAEAEASAAFVTWVESFGQTLKPAVDSYCEIDDG